MNKRLENILTGIAKKFIEDYFDENTSNKANEQLTHWWENFGEDYAKGLIKQNDVKIELNLNSQEEACKNFKPINQNILSDAEKIMFYRSEEKEREYGPFSESMNRAAKIASAYTDLEISAEDMCIFMVAIKMSRLSHKYKYDSLLDAIAYLAGIEIIKNDKK